MYFFKNKEHDNSKVTSQENFPLEGMIIVYVDDLIVCGDDKVVGSFYKFFAQSCNPTTPVGLTDGGPPITSLGFNIRAGQII